MPAAAVTLTVACRLENLALAGAACRAIARELLDDETRAAGMELAIVEACSNIIRHGHPDDVDHTFTIDIAAHGEIDGGGCVMTIRDEGPAFTFDAPEMPSIDVPLDEIPEGGYGLALIHAVVDAVEHRRVDGINEIRVIVHRGT